MKTRLAWLACLTATVLLLLAGPASAQSNQDCLSCHDDPTMVMERGGKKISVNVDPRKMQGTVHADLGCTDCHKGVKADAPHEPKPGTVSCKDCHEDQVKAYDVGRHGTASTRGTDQGATCKACHGSAHEIVGSKDAKSRTYRGNIPKLCGECHGSKPVMTKSGISTRSYESYQESVHGQAFAKGNTKAAVCTDCHRSHDVRSQDDPVSPIFRRQMPTTCGQCHAAASKAYQASIHGKAVARGSSQSPSCSDCHGIHLIKAASNPTSPVSPKKVSNTCGKCHESERLSQEFGVQGDRLSSYEDSYHGLASTLKSSGKVANCASCHGVHDILPSDDPKSRIGAANLATTCRTCHPGAGDNFIQGKVHLVKGQAAGSMPGASPSAPAGPGARPGKAGAEEPAAFDWGSFTTEWVRRMYMLLIFGTIGGMMLHNFLGWRRHVIDHVKNAPRTVERLTLNHRMQHVLLVTSFFVLGFTGFALKYNGSWVSWLLGNNELVRRTGHRVAAIVLIGVGIYHVGYLLLTRPGRRDLVDMWPRLKDAMDVLGNFRYWLGLTSIKPKIARFGYAEKAEYWALVWGTIVMGITGFMLWFPVASLFGFLPRWTIDLATAVHFYEAILACLAVPVWHFYHVFLSPEVYPINWAFWDGHISEEQYRHEHALAWEEMQGGSGSATPEAAGH